MRKKFLKINDYQSNHKRNVNWGMKREAKTIIWRDFSFAVGVEFWTVLGVACEKNLRFFEDF